MEHSSKSSAAVTWCEQSSVQWQAWNTACLHQSIWVGFVFHPNENDICSHVQLCSICYNAAYYRSAWEHTSWHESCHLGFFGVWTCALFRSITTSNITTFSSFLEENGKNKLEFIHPSLWSIYHIHSYIHEIKIIKKLNDVALLPLLQVVLWLHLKFLFEVLSVVVELFK